MNRKVTVVGGAGNVGATVARAIAQRELADVVDRRHRGRRKAAGIALDIYQSCPIEGSAARVVGVGTKDFAESANSDVVVITSGVPRKPGMSRDDLLHGQLQDHAGRHGRRSSSTRRTASSSRSPIRSMRCRRRSIG